MARSRSNDLDFGSDSFLDVIANIVGILIILIVVAGLRAAKSPVETLNKSSVPTEVVVKKTPTLAPPIPPDFDTPRRKIATALPPVPDALPKVDLALQHRIAVLQREIKSLDAKRSRLQSELQRNLATEKTLAGLHRATFRELQDADAKHRKSQARIATLKNSIERNTLELATLRTQYDEAARKTANVKTIRHKLTPVGEEVKGKELHFRLAKGRVSHVPIEDLVKLMREEVLRRKDWLLKFPTHRGIAGPIGGYSMNYVVQRQLTSAIDELRGGYGQVRIVLAGWKVEPTSELVAESADEALRPSSRFLQELRAADADTTVTFWVYPDSFGIFRELQNVAREDGFRIAARPLPFGIPIAGSPSGSRSSGQ